MRIDHQKSSGHHSRNGRRMLVLAATGLSLVVMGALFSGTARPAAAQSEKDAAKAKSAGASETSPAASKSTPAAATTNAGKTKVGKATKNGKDKGVGSIPDPKQVGGEPESIVQVANLVYAGVKSSHCFSDHFLVAAEKESTISTSRRFHAVKLASEEMFNYPLVIMTGEGAFALSQTERENLRTFVERGGF